MKVVLVSPQKAQVYSAVVCIEFNIYLGIISKDRVCQQAFYFPESLRYTQLHKSNEATFMTTAILDALIVIAGAAVVARGASQPVPEAIPVRVRNDERRS